MQAAHLILSFASIIKSTMKKILLTLAFAATSIGLFAQEGPSLTLPDTRADVDPQFAPFYHGVASGDPLSDCVIIWTRLSDYVGASVPVSWQMATDTNFANIVNSGNANADSVNDYCVKVDVTGLLPNTYYYYRFQKDNRNSLIGRTHTLPVGDIDSVRFALMSCQSYEAGYYNAHASVVQRNDIDAVIFVGDYIYEYEGFGDIRSTEPPREILTLNDYRIRHSYYKLDTDLRRSMQNYPYICVWDDHEITNDGWQFGAENHTEGAEGQWANRRMWALKTYFDWMPVRQPDPQNDPERIYRTFRYGDLIELMMLDTRYEGRNEQVSVGQQNADTNRTILGTVQRDWLLNQMDATTARWKVLGQQVMMAPLRVAGQAVNMDQWDGYPADRDRVQDHVMANNINNFVVLTGDIHTAWANDLPQTGVNYNSNTGAGSVGVEFVCSSVTSGNAELALLNGVGVPVIKLLNPHMKYIDLVNHGYTIIDINKTRTQGDYYSVSDITVPSSASTFQDGYYCLENTRTLVQAPGASVRVDPNPPLAPALPANPVGVKEDATNAVIFGTFPNPMTTQLVIQYYMYKDQNVTMQIFDMQGKKVLDKNLGKRSIGLNYTDLDVTSLKAGTYVLAIQMPDKVYKRFVVKM
jgi:alkaline phosphatase D